MCKLWAMWSDGMVAEASALWRLSYRGCSVVMAARNWWRGSAMTFAEWVLRVASGGKVTGLWLQPSHGWAVDVC